MPGQASDRVGRAIQPVISGVPSAAEHDAVVVLAQFSEGIRRGLCSATFVAPNLLLTARHCVSNADSSIACNTDGTAAVGAVIHEDVPPENLAVFVGKDGVPPSLDDESGAVARGAKLVVDESDTLCNHDLAFVLLDRPIDAPIATLRLSGGPTPTERVTVVGWGVDETGTLPATRMARESVAVVGVGPMLMPLDKRFGVGNAEVIFGESACAGDSGGPAFTQSGVLVGVASRVGNGQPRDPNNYAATCVGDTAHAIYTHLGQSEALVKRAFDAAGNYPVVEPPPLSVATPPSSDAPKTDVAPDPTATSPVIETPDRQLLASATAIADAPPTSAEDGGCTMSTGRRAQGNAPWLVLFGVLLAIRARAASRPRHGR